MYLQIMVPIHKPCPFPENKFLNKQGCAVSILLIQLPNDVITKYYHIIYTNRRRLEFVFESLRIHKILFTKYWIYKISRGRASWPPEGPTPRRPLTTHNSTLGWGWQVQIRGFFKPISIGCMPSLISFIDLYERSTKSCRLVSSFAPWSLKTFLQRVYIYC